MEQEVSIARRVWPPENTIRRIGLIWNACISCCFDSVRHYLKVLMQHPTYCCTEFLFAFPRYFILLQQFQNPIS